MQLESCDSASFIALPPKYNVIKKLIDLIIPPQFSFCLNLMASAEQIQCYCGNISVVRVERESQDLLVELSGKGEETMRKEEVFQLGVRFSTEGFHLKNPRVSLLFCVLVL